MGARQDRWFTRVVSRIPLLLLAALLVVGVGAVPGSRAGAAPQAPPGDPPGNNGTVKIDQSDVPDEDKGNEPIGDNCIFWLKFYGFDKDQRAVITFGAHPPSGSKNLVTDDGPNHEGVLISDDAAGGGQDEDEVISYDLTSAVQGLKAHPKHGYHIKLTVDVKGAPGAGKHKVFWIKCAPAPTTKLRIAKALQGTGAGPFTFELRCNHRVLDTIFTLQAGEKKDLDVPPGTTCVATETANGGAQSTTIAENPPHGKADDGVVKVAAKNPTTVTFTNVFPGTGGTPAPDDSDIRTPSVASAGETGGTGTSATKPGASVLAETATRPQGATSLPRTGGDPRPLTATGLWSLGAGVLALLGGRRLRRS